MGSIRLKRGLSANIHIITDHDLGELFYTSDLQEIFIGLNNGISLDSGGGTKFWNMAKISSEINDVVDRIRGTPLLSRDTFKKLYETLVPPGTPVTRDDMYKVLRELVANQWSGPAGDPPTSLNTCQEFGDSLNNDPNYYTHTHPQGDITSGILPISRGGSGSSSQSGARSSLGCNAVFSNISHMHDYNPWHITSTITLEVNWTTGSDDGSSPFKTPHGAMDYLAKRTISNNQIVNVHCAAGTYDLTSYGTLYLNHPTGGRIHIYGDGWSTTDFFFNTGSTIDGAIQVSKGNANYIFNDIKIRGAGLSGSSTEVGIGSYDNSDFHGYSLYIVDWHCGIRTKNNSSSYLNSIYINNCQVGIQTTHNSFSGLDTCYIQNIATVSGVECDHKSYINWNAGELTTNIGSPPIHGIKIGNTSMVKIDNVDVYARTCGVSAIYTHNGSTIQLYNSSIDYRYSAIQIVYNSYGHIRDLNSYAYHNNSSGIICQYNSALYLATSTLNSNGYTCTGNCIDANFNSNTHIISSTLNGTWTHGFWAQYNSFQHVESCSTPGTYTSSVCRPASYVGSTPYYEGIAMQGGHIYRT